jgi:hypothetical protein
MAVILAEVTGFPSVVSAVLTAWLLAGELSLRTCSATPSTAPSPPTGICLGVRKPTLKRARRSCVQIPWPQVQEIRIYLAPAGSIVDVVLAVALSPRRGVMSAG